MGACQSVEAEVQETAAEIQAAIRQGGAGGLGLPSGTQWIYGNDISHWPETPFSLVMQDPEFTDKIPAPVFKLICPFNICPSTLVRISIFPGMDQIDGRNPTIQYP